MKIDGYSYDILSRINPQKIRIYLNSSGWISEEKESDSETFSNPKNGEVVVVPNDKTSRNYAYRVEEIVKTLSESEGISVQRILSGFTLASATDIMEYCYKPENEEIGSIPVPEIIKIVQKGDEINKYAYRDLVDYSLSYRNSNWKGNGVLDKVRIGPTIPGSYVIQFLYPVIETHSGQVSTNLEGGLNSDSTLSNICDKIEESLTAVVKAAESGKTELDPELKISHNFVNSILGLESDKAELDIKRIKVIGKKDEARSPVNLTKHIFERIRPIEIAMRPPEMELEQELIGRVTETRDQRETPSDGCASIRIAYFDKDNKTGTALIKLDGEDLDLAYDAAKSRKLLSITGVLVGNGHNKHIDNVTSLKLID